MFSVIANKMKKHKKFTKERNRSGSRPDLFVHPIKHPNKFKTKLPKKEI
jgi:hypothetical protein